MTHWQSGMRLTSARLGKRESGEVKVSFTNESAVIRPVIFAQPFTAPPHVTTQIATFDSVALRWDSRPFDVTTTGFTLYLYDGDGFTTAVDWQDIPVYWIAVL
ncbi:H-type lectin domain-containing protein [Salinispora mooreana]|uniref:H-type lectin domain-containing protein n=1 Tax=Salinispora mooreana TaxID=999545 RepID=UPI00035FC38B|nr:H-type lectin domain-containing protein [Salinispora mooreana]